MLLEVYCQTHSKLLTSLRNIKSLGPEDLDRVISEIECEPGCQLFGHIKDDKMVVVATQTAILPFPEPEPVKEEVNADYKPNKPWFMWAWLTFL